MHGVDDVLIDPVVVELDAIAGNGLDEPLLFEVFEIVAVALRHARAEHARQARGASDLPKRRAQIAHDVSPFAGAVRD